MVEERVEERQRHEHQQDSQHGLHLRTKLRLPSVINTDNQLYTTTVLRPFVRDYPAEPITEG